MNQTVTSKDRAQVEIPGGTKRSPLLMVARRIAIGSLNNRDSLPKNVFFFFFVNLLTLRPSKM